MDCDFRVAVHVVGILNSLMWRVILLIEFDDAIGLEIVSSSVQRELES